MGKRHAHHAATPATQALDRAHIPYTLHSYTNEVEHEYGTEAATALELAPERVFKTLIVQIDHDELAVGIVPVAGRLNLKAIAAAHGGKRASLADRALAERKTGYVIGGISPFGQKTRLAQVLDASAMVFDTIYVSGGRRGVDVEITPDALLQATGATVHDIAA